MPYGCLGPKKLSAASDKALEKALERWQSSMQISRPKTFLVIAGHEDDAGLEVELKKEVVFRSLAKDEFSTNVIAIRAKNEEDLANKIARNKTLWPIQTLILFAESRHALSVRPIFKRKFGKALEIKKFRADFEPNHPWISTASSSVWFLRNLVLRIWIETRKRVGRRLRKKLKFLFWS
ncbi:MAG: hypothetical protein ACE5JO_01360 [Candidatus Binatia bacterium]